MPRAAQRIATRRVTEENTPMKPRSTLYKPGTSRMDLIRGSVAGRAFKRAMNEAAGATKMLERGRCSAAAQALARASQDIGEGRSYLAVTGRDPDESAAHRLARARVSAAGRQYRNECVDSMDRRYRNN